jgi:hypothetical protein
MFFKMFDDCSLFKIVLRYASHKNFFLSRWKTLIKLLKVPILIELFSAKNKAHSPQQEVRLFGSKISFRI